MYRKDVRVVHDMGLATIPPRADIVVAGGGPAGATISRLLAGFGFRVVVLEKHRFPRQTKANKIANFIAALS